MAESFLPSLGLTPETVFEQGVKMAFGAVSDVGKQLLDFDAAHLNCAKKATDELCKVVEKLQDSVVELEGVVNRLQDPSTELPGKALAHSLATASTAMTQLCQRAQQYDETSELQDRISPLLSHPRTQLNAALVALAAYSADFNNEQTVTLRSISDALWAKLREDEILPPSEDSEKTNAWLIDALKAAAEKFKITARWHDLTSKVQELEERWVAPTLASARQVGQTMLAAIQSVDEKELKQQLRKAAHS